ncbi:MAG: hypothetical protein R3E77_16625 [Steroidobacteraceae bacterium]
MRKQEKIGWAGGWAGGFVWVLILSVVLAARGETLKAMIGVLVCIGALVAIKYLSPWRHPRTPYRQLMLPIYAVFLGAIAWGIWSFGPRELGLHGWWSLLLLLPLTMPLWLIGDRRWEDE